MTIQPAIVQDSRIIFRNFAGKEGQYNREGDRSFALILEPGIAEAMSADGWNVKFLNQREDEDEPTAYLQVSVNYRGRSKPKVVLITERPDGSTNQQLLTEDEVDILDWADIKSVDVKLNPYEWTVNGNSGVKAYLHSIYVVINQDELDMKYADNNPSSGPRFESNFDD